MRIVIYVPGMSVNGEIIKTQSLGGSETAGYQLSVELAKRGHEVIVFSNISDAQSGRFDGVLFYPIGEITQGCPFGVNFESYAEVCPHDVLIAQRVPSIFAKPYMSKINLWWTHDLALKRGQGYMNAQLPFIDGVLTVSEWHKQQVSDVYGIKKDFSLV